MIEPVEKINDNLYCDVCRRSIENCICPECKMCGETGNKKCYEKHDLVNTRSAMTENRFKIEIVGKTKIKDEEWAALLFGVCNYVEYVLNLKDKYHVHLQEVEKEEA